MIASDWDKPVEIWHPEPPKPLTFAFRQAPDPMDLRMARTPEERQRVYDRLKHLAAHRLAEFIRINCKFFEVDYFDPDKQLQIEVTINDRGTYENWVPVAEERGRARGKEQAIKQMVASLPYGLADAAQEFYE